MLAGGKVQAEIPWWTEPLIAATYSSKVKEMKRIGTLAQRFEAILVSLNGPLPEHQLPVIGDMAYLYVCCGRLRDLVDDLLSRSPTPDVHESIQSDLSAILAEIQNINSSTKDSADGLECFLHLGSQGSEVEEGYHEVL